MDADGWWTLLQLARSDTTTWQGEPANTRGKPRCAAEDIFCDETQWCGAASECKPRQERLTSDNVCDGNF